MMKKKDYRQKVAYIFDDRNIHKRLDSAILNYSIIFLIFISVFQIILEVNPAYAKYQNLFKIINNVTIAIFTIEYIIRFWVSDKIDAKYKGWKGKVRYFFSFYALIDFIAIAPFYASFLLTGTSLSVFRVLRVIRVLRILRYLKSFEFIVKATSNKKSELFISMQVLLILTFVFSVFMYNVENKAQPENFATIWDAILWSISKFIGGIGGFGDFSPITPAGKVLATFIGLLAIAIFALPAGIIASGFVEEIENEKQEKELTERAMLIASSFEKKNKDKTLNIIVPVKYRPFSMINSALNYGDSEIYEAIRYSNNLRIKWDKSTPNAKTWDMTVIEHFEMNASYGLFERNIDRKDELVDSDITIICGSGRGERAISHFSRCLARYGKFNLVLNEYFSPNDIHKVSKMSVDLNNYYENGTWQEKNRLSDLCNDILQVKSKSKCNILIRAAASRHPNQFHFLFGGDKGDKIDQVKKPTLNSIDEFKPFYFSIKNKLEEREYKVGTHESFPNTSKRLLHQWVYDNTKKSTITLFISINVLAVPISDKSYLSNIKLIADEINDYLSENKDSEYHT